MWKWMKNLTESRPTKSKWDCLDHLLYLDTCSLGFFSNKPSFVQTSRKSQQMSCPTRKLQQMGFGCQVASTIPMGLASQTTVKVVHLLWELQHRQLWNLYNSYANCITDSCESCPFTMGTTAQTAVKVVQFLWDLHHRQLWKLSIYYGNCSTKSCKSCAIPMRIASQTTVKVVHLLWELQHRQLWNLYNSYANCITDSCESCPFTMGTTAQRAVKVGQVLCGLHHRELWKLN